ncbi:hypothetical protein THII_0812 [Thioploca ingrica]|uniref:Uncharacterized protein n=1 Tax=Thioploca ingrica TaxID=40754 RepID=A0A090ADZ3_9GAMM|nr:hypothetical protein THII_0812 [Thioploca ingrica]
MHYNTLFLETIPKVSSLPKDQDMFTIEWIQTKVSQSEYYFSKHGDQERQNDNLSIAEAG